MWVDGALLASAVSGDRTATGALPGLLHPGVLRYCQARLGELRHRDSDADDCAQEVLIGVLGALPGYRYGAGKFLGFVYGVAAHQVVDVHRRRGTDVSVPAPEPCGRRGPLRHVEDFERRQRLHHLLDLLAPRQRDIVVLRVVLGMSAHDTAAVLGVAGPGAVRVSRHRALTALRGHIAAAPVP